MEQEVHYITDDLAAVEWALGCLLASYVERVKAMNFYQRVNRIGAIAPTVMSILALALVLVVVTTGWERHLKDEGAAAHIFQLLIVGQVPFVLGFLITANWRRLMQIVRPMIFQAVALTLAIGSVAFFKL